MIALTFDDGPGPSTPEILDTLRVHQVRATFFIIGRNLQENPWTPIPGTGRSIVNSALLDDHIVGNHSYTHARELQDEQEFVQEIAMTDALLCDLYVSAGRLPETLALRLPFGPRPNDPRLRYIAAMGRQHVHWSKDFHDWREGPNEELFPAMLAYVEQRERAGLNSVLDLHDSGIGLDSGYYRPATAEAVRLLLEESSRRGWKFFQVPV